MKFGSFNRIITIIVVVLSSLIVILGYLLFQSGPRVRFLDFEVDLNNTVLTVGTSVNIVFDRPLRDSDYTDQIYFIPEIDFSTKTLGQTITVLFEENLQQDTEYSLIVKDEIYDTKGKRMQSQATKRFKTAPYRYAYIQRNYGFDVDTLNVEDDLILQSTIDGNSKVLFRYPQILSFKANNRYSLVAGVNEFADSIFIVDNSNGKSQAIQMPFEGRILKLAVSARSNIGAFILRPEYDQNDIAYYESYANRTYTVNLETGAVTEIVDQIGNPIKSYDIAIDTNGQYILIQDDRQIYYIASPLNEYTPLPIGSYTIYKSQGIAANSVIFRNASGFTEVDIATGANNEITIPIEGYVQDVLFLNRNIALYSPSYYAGVWSAEIYMFDGTTKEDIWNLTSKDTLVSSLGASYDGKLLSITSNGAPCDQDAIGSNSVCKDIRTEIYDRAKQETVNSFYGFDLIWLP